MFSSFLDDGAGGGGVILDFEHAAWHGSLLEIATFRFVISSWFASDRHIITAHTSNPFAHRIWAKLRLYNS